MARVLLPATIAGCAASTPVSKPMVCEGCTDLRFVAHEDDDLLFMNPDLAASLATGNRVVTIFLTAGTPFDEARLTEREAGILNAYTFMATPDAAITDRSARDEMVAHWRSNLIEANDHRAVEYDLAGTNVSIVFLRNEEEQLSSLWRGDQLALATVPCANDCLLGSALPAQTYDRGSLIDMLGALLDRFDDPALPLVVSTQDSTGVFALVEDWGLGWVDNSDHVAGAKFATSAFVRHARDGATLVQYRGYDTARSPANLGERTRDKRRTFYRYYCVGEAMTGLDERGRLIEYTNNNPDDPHFWLDSYDIWTQRRYPIATASDELGPLAVGTGCLDAAGAMSSCADAPTWQLSPDHHVRVDASHCLALDDADRARVAPCTAGEAQTWLYNDTHELVGRGAACLTADDSGVHAATCAAARAGHVIPAQQWRWTAATSVAPGGRRPP